MNSYLTERKQFVQIDDKRSPLVRVYYGVPQGSILGSILTFMFTIYQKVQLVNVFNLLTTLYYIATEKLKVSLRMPTY